MTMHGSFQTIRTPSPTELVSWLAKFCAAVLKEEGPFLGKVCSGPVTSIVKSLLQGRTRLTTHGLWAAFYVTTRVTSGTW